MRKVVTRERSALSNLVAAIEAEARALRLKVDRPVYERAHRRPACPILFAGDLGARVCFFGRDLGRAEVDCGQPFVGPAGRRVRKAVLETVGHAAPVSDDLLETALEHALFTNVVPYKPPGNKPFAASVVERLRPYVARLLVCHWRGDVVIAFGRHAYAWFAPYAQDAGTGVTWAECVAAGERRFRIRASCDGREAERPVLVCPLPHPSPANALWAARFPAMLSNVLDRWLR